MSDRAPTLRLIIAYKLARAALSLGAAVVLALLVSSGETEHLRELADTARQHLASRWSDLLASALTPHHLWLAAVALALDGALVLVEGWSLWRGYRWAPWLVVVSTAALLPFEVVGLWRHPHLGRAVLLLGNIAVALYLAREAQRDRRK